MKGRLLKSILILLSVSDASLAFLGSGRKRVTVGFHGKVAFRPRFAVARQPVQSNTTKKRPRPSLDMHPLNNKIEKLRKEDIDAAIKLLHRAIEDGVTGSSKPNAKSFHLVLTALIGSDRTEAAEDMLTRMKSSLGATTYGYNCVMEVWIKSKASSRRDVEINVMRLYDELISSNLEPNAYTCTLLMSLYRDTSPEKVEKWFDSIKSVGIPDLQSYNVLFATFAQHGRADNAEETIYNIIKGASVALNPIWFNNVLKALSRSSIADAGKRADQVFSLMIQRNFRPNIVTYNHLIDVHAISGSLSRVDELFDTILRGTVKDVQPDKVTFTTVIKAYSRAFSSCIIPRGLALRRAEEVFQLMLDKADAGETHLAPNLITYNTMISLLTSAGTREGLMQASNWLRRMESSQSGISPDSVSYSSLIHGWSRSGLGVEAALRAEQLLDTLERLPPNRRQTLKWTIVYNSVISAWGKANDKKVALVRVEALLARLEDMWRKTKDPHACPDRTTYLCVVDAYAKAAVSNAEDVCEHILDRMKDLQEEGAPCDLRPDRPLYNSILNALAKSCQPFAKEKAEDIVTLMQNAIEPTMQPDIVTYSTLIDCYTKSGGNCTTSRAEELLYHVEGSYRNGNALLKPNAVFYSAIMQAWAKSESAEGARKAEALLRRNEGLYAQGNDYAKPHAIMFNAVMDAIARSGQPGSGACAEELLREMENLCASGADEMKPTVRSFNAVMLAYRQQEQTDDEKQSSALHVERLLSRMENAADKGMHEIHPNVVSYNCAIGAWCDVPDPVRAQALLDRMETRGIAPDGTTYSLVIEAWLKQHSEQASFMVEDLLQRFTNMVELTRDAQDLMKADAVWKVIEAYQSGKHNPPPA